MSAKSKPTLAGTALRAAAEGCQYPDGSCLYGELYRQLENPRYRRGRERAWAALNLVADERGTSYDWWGRPNVLLTPDTKHNQHERVVAGCLAAAIADDSSQELKEPKL